MYKLLIKTTLLLALVITFTCCEDNLVGRDGQPVGGKTIAGDGPEHPSNKKKGPGESYPYPKIISTEYIPGRDFDDLKCLAWRITWPLYDSDYDKDLIPTVFAFSDSSLHSINYLNNTHFSNTIKSVVSLYANMEVKSANMMHSDLLWLPNVHEQMQYVNFGQTDDITLPQMQEWVEGRPQLFESYYPADQWYDEMSYEEGDLINMYLTEDKLYGGIRIVSMTPRIIELYLAVPNY
jgi:hypothetical protein